MAGKRKYLDVPEGWEEVEQPNTDPAPAPYTPPIQRGPEEAFSQPKVDETAPQAQEPLKSATKQDFNPAIGLASANETLPVIPATEDANIALVMPEGASVMPQYPVQATQSEPAFKKYVDQADEYAKNLIIAKKGLASQGTPPSAQITPSTALPQQVQPQGQVVGPSSPAYSDAPPGYVPVQPTPFEGTTAEKAAESMKRSNEAWKAKDERYSAMLSLDPARMKAAIDEEEARTARDINNPVETKGLWETSVAGAAQSIPGMLKSQAKGILSGAGAVALGKAVFKEIPAAKVFKYANLGASGYEWFKQGASDFFFEQVKAGINPKVARAVAIPAGILYAATEFATGIIPGMEYLVKTSPTFAATVKKSIGSIIGKYAKAIGLETTEEGAQQLTQDFAFNVGAYLSNAMAGTDVKLRGKGEVISNSILAFTSSLGPVTLLMGLHPVHNVMQAKKIQGLVGKLAQDNPAMQGVTVSESKEGGPWELRGADGNVMATGENAIDAIKKGYIATHPTLAKPVAKPEAGEEPTQIVEEPVAEMPETKGAEPVIAGQPAQVGQAFTPAENFERYLNQTIEEPSIEGTGLSARDTTAEAQVGISQKVDEAFKELNKKKDEVLNAIQKPSAEKVGQQPVGPEGVRKEEAVGIQPQEQGAKVAGEGKAVSVAPGIAVGTGKIVEPPIKAPKAKKLKEKIAKRAKEQAVKPLPVPVPAPVVAKEAPSVLQPVAQQTPKEQLKAKIKARKEAKQPISPAPEKAVQVPAGEPAEARLPIPERAAEVKPAPIKKAGTTISEVPNDGVADLNGKPATKKQGVWSFANERLGKIRITDPKTISDLDAQLIGAKPAEAQGKPEPVAEKPAQSIEEALTSSKTIKLILPKTKEGNKATHLRITSEDGRKMEIPIDNIVKGENVLFNTVKIKKVEPLYWSALKKEYTPIKGEVSVQGAKAEALKIKIAKKTKAVQDVAQGVSKDEPTNVTPSERPESVGDVSANARETFNRVRQKADSGAYGNDSRTIAQYCSTATIEPEWSKRPESVEFQRRLLSKGWTVILADNATSRLGGLTIKDDRVMIVGDNLDYATHEEFHSMVKDQDATAIQRIKQEESFASENPSIAEYVRDIIAKSMGVSIDRVPDHMIIEDMAAYRWQGHGKVFDALTAEKAKPAAEKVSIPVEEPPTKVEAKPVSIKPVEIEDFGEKIGGARKDAVPSASREISDSDLATMTFSDIWPKSEVDAIEDNDMAALATAIRSIVPSKPRKAYRVDRWIEQVKLARSLMDTANRVGFDKMMSQMPEWNNGSLKVFADKVNLLRQLPRQHWDRIGKVENFPNAYTYERVDGKMTNKQIPSPFAVADVDGRNVRAKNLEELPAAVNERLGIAVDEAQMQFEVRGKRDGSEYFINKKGDPLYRKLKTFTGDAALQDARKFIQEHKAELVTEWGKVKESDNVKETDVRRKENRPRTAVDYRKGKDVTPQMFMDTLGFRGVEFGNWVSQGLNRKERQGMLNEAYDALMDLSGIMGVPAKAISLDGELALGFGSRGHGWASAHYEPDKVVINLTKTRGAGSLAHEWFHALDHYFQRKRPGGGRISEAGEEMITYQPEAYYEHTKTGHRLSASRYKRITEQGGISNAEEWKRIEGVRPEVEESFVDLVKALDDSPMAKRSALIDKGKSGGYWGRIIERAARAFENYVIYKMGQKGYQNDYLANVVKMEEFKRDIGRYPYLMETEVAPVADAFDGLFATIKTRETKRGIEMYGDIAKREEGKNERLGIEADERQRIDDIGWASDTRSDSEWSALRQQFRNGWKRTVDARIAKSTASEAGASEQIHWQGVTYSEETEQSEYFRKAYSVFERAGLTTVPISYVPWGAGVDYDSGVVFWGGMSSRKEADEFLHHELTHIQARQNNADVKTMMGAVSLSHPLYKDYALKTGLSETALKEEISAAFVSGGIDQISAVFTVPQQETRLRIRDGQRQWMSSNETQAARTAIAITNPKGITRAQFDEAMADETSAVPFAAEGVWSGRFDDAPEMVKAAMGKGEGQAAIADDRVSNIVFGVMRGIREKMSPHGFLSSLAKQSASNKSEAIRKISAGQALLDAINWDGPPIWAIEPGIDSRKLSGFVNRAMGIGEVFANSPEKVESLLADAGFTDVKRVRQDVNSSYYGRSGIILEAKNKDGKQVSVLLRESGGEGSEWYGPVVPGKIHKAVETGWDIDHLASGIESAISKFRQDNFLSQYEAKRLMDQHDIAPNAILKESELYKGKRPLVFRDASDSDLLVSMRSPDDHHPIKIAVRNVDSHVLRGVAINREKGGLFAYWNGKAVWLDFQRSVSNLEDYPKTVDGLPEGWTIRSRLIKESFFGDKLARPRIEWRVQDSSGKIVNVPQSTRQEAIDIAKYGIGYTEDTKHLLKETKKQGWYPDAYVTSEELTALRNIASTFHPEISDIISGERAYNFETHDELGMEGEQWKLDNLKQYGPEFLGPTALFYRSSDGTIRAVTIGKQSWFFTDRYDNVSQLREDIREEAGHRLVNELGGKEWSSIGFRAYRGAWGKVVSEIERNYGFKQGTPEFNHELVTKAFRDGKNDVPMWRRFLDAVVSAFRKLAGRIGFDVKLSDAEVRDFINGMLAAKAKSMARPKVSDMTNVTDNQKNLDETRRRIENENDEEEIDIWATVVLSKRDASVVEGGKYAGLFNRIKGEGYRVVFVEGSDRLTGVTDEKSKNIFINLDHDEDLITESFLHESFHALLDVGDQRALLLASLINVKSRAFSEYFTDYMSDSFQRSLAIQYNAVEWVANEYASDYFKGILSLASGFKNASQAESLRQDILATSQAGRAPSTFYSALSEAVDKMALKQAIPGGQMLYKIMGLQGVKKQEIEESGLADWLKMQSEQGKNVTKDQVSQFMRENGVQIETVEKGGEGRIGDVEAWWNDEGGANEATPFSELNDAERNAAIERYQEEVEQYSESDEATKFSQYVPPGGVPGSYRELLLTLPIPNYELPSEYTVRQTNASHGRVWQVFDAKGKDIGGGETRDTAIANAAPEWQHGKRDIYQSPHWSEPNVLAHMLMDERRIPLDVLAKTQPMLAAKLKAEGKTEARALHMIEGQSDWQQRISAEGSMPDMPLLMEKISMSSMVKPLADALEKQGVSVQRIDDYAIVYTSPKTGKKVVAIENAPNGADAELRLRQYDATGKNIKAETVKNLLNKGLVPNAPFRGDAWKRLVIRKMLAEAADGGYDLLTWSTGADRAKQWGSERVEWKRSNLWHVVDKSGGERVAPTNRLMAEKEALRQGKEYKAEPVEGWQVAGTEQSGGEYQGQNIEEMARQRGILLEQKGTTVRTKEDLREIVGKIIRDPTEGKIDKLTNRIWDRMQTEPEGTSMPRREFFEFLYDKSFVNEANDIVRKMDKGVKVGETSADAELEGWTVLFNGGPTTDHVYDTENDAKIVLRQSGNAGVDGYEVKKVSQKAMSVHAIPITSEIRSSVKAGQPYYARGESEQKDLSPDAAEFLQRIQDLEGYRGRAVDITQTIEKAASKAEILKQKAQLRAKFGEQKEALLEKQAGLRSALKAEAKQKTSEMRTALKTERRIVEFFQRNATRKTMKYITWLEMAADGLLGAQAKLEAATNPLQGKIAMRDFISDLFGNEDYGEIEKVYKSDIKHAFNTINRNVNEELHRVYSERLAQARKAVKNPNELNPKFRADIMAILGEISEQRMSDMDWRDIRVLANNLMSLATQDKNEKFIIAKDRLLTALQAGEKATAEVKASTPSLEMGTRENKRRNFVIDQMIDQHALPYTKSIMAGGSEKSVTYDLNYEANRIGETAQKAQERRVRAEIDKAIADAGISDDKRIDMTVKMKPVRIGGKTMQWSDFERLHFAASMQDPENLRHTQKAGFILGRFSSSPGMVIGGKNVQENNALINDVLKTITPKENELVTKIVDILTAMGKEGNKTSMMIDGFERFIKSRYFPRVVARALSNINMDNMIRSFYKASLEHLGITQERVKNVNPLVVGDLVQTAYHHVNQMTRYTHLTIPIRNNLMLLGNVEFADAIRNTYGQRWIDNQIKMLNQLAGFESHLTGFQKLMAIVNKNATVFILGFFRPVSYINNRIAGGMLAWSELKNMESRVSLPDLAWMLMPQTLKFGADDNAILKKIMTNGYMGARWEMDFAKLFNPNFIEDPSEVATSRLKIAWKQIQQKGLAYMAHAEQRNAIRMFKVLKSLGHSDESALDLIEQVTRRTQNPSSVLEESPWLLTNKESGLNFLFPFFGQVEVARSLLMRDAVGFYRTMSGYSEEAKNKAFRRLLRTTLSLVAGLMVGNVAREIMRKLRRKDEDRRKKEDATAKVAMDVARDGADYLLPGAGRVMDGISAVAQGRQPMDTTLPGQILTKIYRGLGYMMKLSEHSKMPNKEKLKRGILNLLEAAGMLTGAPLGGAEQYGQIIAKQLNEQ